MVFVEFLFLDNGELLDSSTDFRKSKIGGKQKIAGNRYAAILVRIT